jgi:hypothetical protein
MRREEIVSDGIENSGMEGNERGIQLAVKPWMGMHRSWGIALKYAEYQETPNKHVGFKAYSCLCNAKIRDTPKAKCKDTYT